MDIFAWALVVSGAVAHAAWNLIAKKVAAGAPFVWLYGAVSALVTLPFAWLWWPADPGSWNADVWVAIAGSAAAHLGYSLALQRGYRAGDFSLVYPIARGLGPLCAVLLALLVLGERPSIRGWVAIALILAAIPMVAGTSRKRPTSARPQGAVAWGGITGLMIGAYTVIDGWALKDLGAPLLPYYALGLLLRTLLLAPPVLRNPRELLRHWQASALAIVSVGVLSPLAYVLVLAAMRRAPVVYVAPARELSMLIAALLATRLLGETLTRLRIAGIVLMLSGVAQLALAR